MSNLQERISKALATEGLEIGEVLDPRYTTTGLVVTIRERVRDRGREVAERMIHRIGDELRFNNPIDSTYFCFASVCFPEISLRQYVAAAINAERAALIRDVLDIYDRGLRDGSDLGLLRDRIAALAPKETP